MAISLIKGVLSMLLLYTSAIIYVMYSQRAMDGHLYFQQTRSDWDISRIFDGGIYNETRSLVETTISEGISLSEKFTAHITQTAFLKFKNKITKYGRFNANTSILLYNGTLSQTMFKDWNKRKSRPKESPPIGTYESCAVIGNSGVIVDSQCGHEIDEHEFVIRNNMAPTSGFEDDVGTKTSLMSINSALVVSIMNCLQNTTCRPTYVSKLKGLSKNTILWYSKVFSPSVRQKQYYAMSLFVRNNSLPLRIAFPSSKLSTTGFWKIKHASSGLMMLSMAATFCRNITLYGFYPYLKLPTGRKVNYHYYETVSFKNSHHMDDEYKQLQQLNKQGVIRVITDKCNYTRPSTLV